MSATVKVTDVYGRVHLVDRAILEAGKRTQIPLYTKSGKRLVDYYEEMGWSGQGRCTTIHRDNIAKGPQ